MSAALSSYKEQLSERKNARNGEKKEEEKKKTEKKERGIFAVLQVTALKCFCFRLLYLM